jgi:hypothetical protein
MNTGVGGLLVGGGQERWIRKVGWVQKHGTQEGEQNGNGGGERWLAAEKRGQWSPAATGGW